MEIIKDTLRFWVHIIIVPSLRASLNFKQIASKLFEIIASLLVAVFLVVVLNLSVNIPDVGSEIAFLILIAFVTITVRIVGNLLYLPAKIFKKQGGFIENPFEITTLDPQIDQSQPYTKWVTIKITNKSKFAKVENCFVKLNRITDLQAGELIPFEPQILKWSGREQESVQDDGRSLVMNPDDPRWCDIAKATTPYIVTAVGGWIEPEPEPTKVFTAAYETVYGSRSEHNVIEPGKYRLFSYRKV